MKTAGELIEEYVVKEIQRDYPELSDQTLEEIIDGYYYRDYLDEFRRSGERTGIKSDAFSRYYDNEEVARVLDFNGEKIAVGWTYWTGGGKHGEPGAMPWLENAYFCNYTQEPRLVNVFTRKVNG